MNKALIEQTLEAARRSVEQGSEFATAFHLQTDGSMTIMAIDNSFFVSSQQKNLIATRILIDLDKSGGTFVLCADSWRATEKKRSDLPRNFADLPPDQREECLLLWANSPGELGVSVQQRYSRDKDGKPQWGEVEYLEPKASRWAFDLRTRTPRQLLMDLARFNSLFSAIMGDGGKAR